MQLLVTQSIQNDNYVFGFTIAPASISSDDAALFQKYGPQIVNFGATTATTYAPSTISVYASYSTTTSLGIGSATDTYNLPDNYVNLPAGFPYQVTFTSISPSPFATNTTARLLAYRQYIQAQVYSIITTLRATADAFTGDFITNI